MPKTRATATPPPLSPSPPIPDFPAAMDLRCTLCPKTPTFSDISHLLTHIASKSHLSNKFKLEVESRHQKAAKVKLDDFDYWYNSNNLDDMLSDRMVAKEDKKKRKSRPPVVKQEIKQEFKVSKRSRADSEFGEVSISKRSREDSEFRAPSARMHQTKSRTTVYASRASSTTGDNEQSIYSTPKTRSKVPNFSDETAVPNQVDPMLNTPWRSEHEEEEEEIVKNLEKETMDEDYSRLKGIQWPGMRVFDAATPEGKRMRNQRKDSKVLRDMIATSKGVEPNEISYHANGDFRASRDIFGPLSTETSPVQVTRLPKQRKPRKPTFRPINTNISRSRPSRPSRAKKPAEKPAEKPSEKPPKATYKSVNVANQYRHPSSINPPNFNPLAVGFSGFGTKYMPSVDEEDEFKLTVGNFAKKKKASFSVFEDNTSPSRTESPLEEPRFEFPSSHSLQPAWSNSMTSDQIPTSPTPAAKPVSRNGSGLNSFNSSNGTHGLPDPSTNHFHARRTMSDSSVFAPMAFHTDFNPLFNHGNHSNTSYQRSYSAYTPQYLFGGPHTNAAYLDSNLHGPMSSMGYHSTFMGDFRQLNPMAINSMNHLQNQSMPSMPSMTSVADMGTSNCNNENDAPFNM